MLQDKNALATVAVKDIERAKKFYEGTLGLKLADGSEPSALVFTAGTSSVLVYTSQYAGTNQATAVTWGVDDVDGVVKDLKSRGVVFEKYDTLPGVTRQGEVHLAGDLKNAWFKDPDGNIHAVVGKK